ncbi:MAG TPA: DUF4142 domain-containing protein [Sphingobacteriaceae bacterium]
MNKWSIFLLVMAGTASVLTSCKKNEVEEFRMDSQTFVTQASSSNNLTIQASTSATQKGVDQLVINYGNAAIADHARADSELTALAASKGITISTSLIAVHQSNLNILNQFTGDTFDQAFGELMELNAQETVNLYDAAAQSLDDADLRQYAATRLPALIANLQQVRNLRSALIE